MRRELFSTAIAAVLLVPALAAAQTSDAASSSQPGMEGEEAIEAPQGDASTADPAQAPDSGSAAGAADDGMQQGATDGTQQGATGEDAQTGVGADSELTAEGLEGADVVDAAGETLGTVDTVALAEDGSVEGVLIDVGGFLGIGAKTVMLTPEEIKVERDPESAEVTLTTDLTKEELEELPEHEES